MKPMHLMLVSTTLAALLGCDTSKQAGTATTTGHAMPATAQAPRAGAQHTAEGTLNAIDAAAGTVNITHGPVASANWPGMTMTFKLANPGAATDLKPGQHVRFQFTIEGGMSATVTQISAAD